MVTSRGRAGVILAFGLALGVHQGWAGFQRVSLMGLAAGEGVTPELAELITGALRTELYRTNKFQIVDRSVIQEHLKEVELNQLGLVEGQATPLGKLEGVDALILGQVGRVEGRYILDARKVNLATGKAEVVISGRSAGDVDAVLDSVKKIARELTGSKNRHGQEYVPRLAVMSYADSGRPADSASCPCLGEIVANEMVHGLAELAEIHVISPFSMGTALAARGMEFADTREPRVASSLVRELGADLVVTGLLSDSGKGWILTTQLTQLKTGKTLGSFKSEPGSKDKVLSQAVPVQLDQLRAELVQASGPRRFGEITTASQEAYRYFLLGFEAQMAGNFRESLTWTEKALELDPDFASCYSLDACNYSFLGELEKSKQNMDKALEYYPRLSEKEKIWLKADKAWLQDDPDLTVLYYKQFMRLYPTDPRGPLYLGLTYRWLFEKFEPALAAIDQALELNPNSFPAYKNKAEILNMMGRTKEAEKALKRFLRLKPPEPLAAEARQALEELKEKG